MKLDAGDLNQRPSRSARARASGPCVRPSHRSTQRSAISHRAAAKRLAAGSRTVLCGGRPCREAGDQAALRHASFRLVSYPSATAGRTNSIELRTRERWRENIPDANDAPEDPARWTAALRALLGGNDIAELGDGHLDLLAPAALAMAGWDARGDAGSAAHFPGRMLRVSRCRPRRSAAEEGRRWDPS